MAQGDQLNAVRLTSKDLYPYRFVETGPGKLAGYDGRTVLQLTPPEGMELRILGFVLEQIGISSASTPAELRIERQLGGEFERDAIVPICYLPSDSMLRAWSAIEPSTIDEVDRFHLLQYPCSQGFRYDKDAQPRVAPGESLGFKLWFSQSQELITLRVEFEEHRIP